MRLAPVRAHEGLARGALVSALVIGAALTATVDVGPPDYWPPLELDGQEVADLTGIETTGGHGGSSTTSFTTRTLETGDDVRVEVAWSDWELAPPAGHRVLADHLHRCARILVTTTASDLDVDSSRLDAFLDDREATIDAFLAGAPRDPCAGRPLAP